MVWKIVTARDPDYVMHVLRVMHAKRIENIALTL